MNNVIIVGYILAVIFLFVSVSASRQRRLKINITWENLTPIIAAMIFVSVLGGKVLTLAQSSSIIEMELVAPSHMTPAGTEAIERALSSSDVRTSLDKCSIEDDCPSEEDSVNSSILTTTHDLIVSSKNHDATAEWLKKNSISLDAMTSWRGRYLHHFSTIMYPVRGILDGDIGLLLSSQYGLASLVPVFFTSGQPFIVYPIAGLIVLMLLGLWIIYKHRHSIIDTVIWGAIFILIAYISNVGALRLSPGFSIFRYLPVLILLYLAHKYLENQKMKYVTLTMVVALLNSLQFNILLLLILFTTFIAISIGKKNSVRIFFLPLALAIMVGLQYLSYIGGANEFTPELFGSVGEGQQSFTYNEFILLFPVFALVLKFLNEKEVIFRNTEILAYVSYGALATYTIAFENSPQHYAGFLQMACLSIYVIVKNCKSWPYQILLLVLLFYFPASKYHYIQASQKVEIAKSSFFNYSEKLGQRLYFSTPTDIAVIADEYTSLIAKHAHNKKTYFLSKDKLFIENYQNKNLDPKTHDVFTNFIKLAPANTMTILAKEQVDFVIIESEIHRTNIRNFINMEKDNLSAEEFQRHIQILSNFDALAELIKPNLVECSSRYCIYSVTKKDS